MKRLGTLLVCLSLVLHCNCLVFRYKTDPVCDGKKSTAYVWSMVEDVSKIICALMCDSEVMCVLVSYNTDTRACYLHTHTLFDLLPTMTPDSNYVCLLPTDFLESWVVNVPESSQQLEGYIPDFIKGEADRWVWIPQVGTTPFIEFDLAMEMYVERVYIYETLGSVAYSKISVRNPAAGWVTVWSGPQVPPTLVDRIYSPELMITNCKTSEVRLDIYLLGSVGHIDAVKVVGKGNQRLRNRIENQIFL